VSAQGTSGASLRRTGAKGAETVLSLTGLDEVNAHVGRELGVSDRRPAPQESLDAFAPASGEERFVHLDAEC
jgi:acyl dehydratase